VECMGLCAGFGVNCEITMTFSRQPFVYVVIKSFWYGSASDILVLTRCFVSELTLLPLWLFYSVFILREYILLK
ncbi:hypothetical protein ACTHH8_004288, partial [Shigella flexneri]